MYIAGKDHSYHRLVDRGLDPARAVLLMQFCGIGLGLVSFIVLETNSLIANAVFASVVLGGTMAMLILARNPAKADT